MAADTFPTFPTRSVTIRRRTLFSTKVQTSTSGREMRASWQSRPRHEYQITFEGLFHGNRMARGHIGAVSISYAEPQVLCDFYAKMRGAWGTFDFVDPLDGQTRTCRFADDALELERFTAHHWKTQGVKIVEVLQ